MSKKSKSPESQNSNSSTQSNDESSCEFDYQAKALLRNKSKSSFLNEADCSTNSAEEIFTQINRESDQKQSKTQLYIVENSTDEEFISRDVDSPELLKKSCNILTMPPLVLTRNVVKEDILRYELYASIRLLTINEFVENSRFHNQVPRKYSIKNYETYYVIDHYTSGINGTFLGKTSDGFVISITADAIDLCSTEELKAIIAHEIGHGILSHDLQQKSIKLEIEADDFAANLVGVDVVLRLLQKAGVHKCPFQKARLKSLRSKRLLKIAA